jgi:hypothetical protein
MDLENQKLEFRKTYDMEKQKFEFRKTYRNWFKGLSDGFPAYKSTIVQYYKGNMDKSHEELLKAFYQQARPYFQVLANGDHAFFESCATFYPEIQYEEFVKDTAEPFRKEQMVYLNKLSYMAILLMSEEENEDNESKSESENEDTSLLYKFVMNVQTLDGTDMANLMKSLESAFDPENTTTTTSHSALLNNPLLSSLAEEISQEITIPDAFKNIESPQDIFKIMMNKDGKSFMEEMVKTVGSKIQNKIKNGELNEQDLFQQAQMMMGSVFNNNPMFGNLFGAAGAGAGAGAGAEDDVETVTPAERKAELRKALREKLKKKRNERN